MTEKRPQRIGPRIRAWALKRAPEALDLLTEHPDGLTRQELADELGTGKQFAGRVIRAARLGLLADGPLNVITDYAHSPPRYRLVGDFQDSGSWHLARYKEMVSRIELDRAVLRPIVDGTPPGTFKDRARYLLATLDYLSMTLEQQNDRIDANGLSR